MASRYAVLSEILSDSSVVYNVFDMCDVSAGPVYEAFDILDAAMRCAVFNADFDNKGILRSLPCEENNWNKDL